MALSHVRGRKNHTGASRPLVEGTADDNQKIAIARARESGARRLQFQQACHASEPRVSGRSAADTLMCDM